MGAPRDHSFFLLFRLSMGAGVGGRLEEDKSCCRKQVFLVPHLSSTPSSHSSPPRIRPSDPSPASTSPLLTCPALPYPLVPPSLPSAMSSQISKHDLEIIYNKISGNTYIGRDGEKITVEDLLQEMPSCTGPGAGFWSTLGLDSGFKQTAYMATDKTDKVRFPITAR